MSQPRKKRKMGKAEGRPGRQRQAAGGGIGAGTARDTASEQRNSPTCRQKHRTSIWHEVST